MKIKLMLEHTDTITDKDEYIIVDDQVIGEIKQIKQSLKRKLSDDDDDDDNIQHLDDYQNELNIVKKKLKDYQQFMMNIIMDQCIRVLLCL